MRATIKLMVLALLGKASLAYAAGEQVTSMGLGTYMFLGFLALIVVFQAIPGLILFYSMIKGLFAPMPLKTAAAEHHSNKTR